MATVADAHGPTRPIGSVPEADPRSVSPALCPGGGSSSQVIVKVLLYAPDRSLLDGM